MTTKLGRGPARAASWRHSGVPAHVQVQHYRIDDEHTNAYTVWKQMGSRSSPSPEQYAKLEAAGQLQLLTRPNGASRKRARSRWISRCPSRGFADPPELVGASFVRLSVCFRMRSSAGRSRPPMTNSPRSSRCPNALGPNAGPTCAARSGVALLLREGGLVTAIEGRTSDHCVLHPAQG